jgi:HprK-related kinase A
LRLLSDEFGLLRPGVNELLPIPRPMPLKNESIAVIRAFVPEAVLGPEIPGTRKGTVCHVQAPASSVRRAQDAAPVRWIVFPRWVSGARLDLREVSSFDGFQQLATNAFNYDVHGAQGFETLKSLIDASRCFRLRYSNLDEAVSSLTALADADVR